VGGLSIGRSDGALIAGVLASARAHDLPHEVLEAHALRARFPALTPPADEVGVLEPDAGVLATEPCVEALLEDAVAAGATLRTSEAVTGWSAHSDGVVIEGTHGAVEADALVLAMGPWLAGTPGGRRMGLWVARQVVFWYELNPLEGVDAGKLPVMLWEHADGRVFYAIPGPGSRIKAALHHQGEVVDPDSVDRVPNQLDGARVHPMLTQLLPCAAGPPVDASVCLYTNTADGHFVVDALPGEERVFVMSACSGHGFKFAPAVAELVTDLVLGERPSFDPAPFRATRFG
jgi:sarcosine oxidase